MKYFVAFAFTAAAAFVVSGVGTSAPQGDKDKGKYTISEVMLKAHKSGLMNRVAIGKGDKKDAESLVEMYKSLSKQKPPAGDPEQWAKRTKELISAAQDVVDGKEGAGARLQKAANCGTCHKAFKG
jgi:hypothetical protein